MISDLAFIEVYEGSTVDVWKIMNAEILYHIFMVIFLLCFPLTPFVPVF